MWEHNTAAGFPTDNVIAMSFWHYVPATSPNSIYPYVWNSNLGSNQWNIGLAMNFADGAKYYASNAETGIKIKKWYYNNVHITDVHENNPANHLVSVTQTDGWNHHYFEFNYTLSEANIGGCLLYTSDAADD